MFLGLLDFLNTCESCVCGIVIESDTTRKPKIRGRKWPPITLKPNKNLKFLTKTQPEPEKRYPKVTQTRHFLPNLITSMECGYTSNLNWWLHYEHFWFQKQPIKIRFSSLPCLAISALKNQQIFRNKKNLPILR